MRGIVVTSHGPLAQGIVDTSKLFFGEQPQIVACCLNANDNPDDFVSVLKDAIDSVDSGDGVYVLCDMLFGTPCNCMARIVGDDLNSNKIEVLTGVNLAMVLQVLSVREATNPTVEELLNSGHEGITDFKQILKANLNQ